MKKKKILLRLIISIFIVCFFLFLWSKNVYYRYETYNGRDYLSEELVQKYRGVDGDDSLLVSYSTHMAPSDYIPLISFEFRLSEEEFKQLRADAKKENPIDFDHFQICYEWTEICKVVTP